MAKRVGKCTNYASCQLAFQNADIEAEGDFVCPECGQPLTDATPTGPKSKPPAKMILYGGIGIAAIIVLILGVVLFAKACGGPKEDRTVNVESPTPTPTPTPTPEPEVTATPTPPPIFGIPEETPSETPSPSPSPTETPREEAIAFPMPTVPATLDRDPASAENVKTRQEVLKRVDMIPDLTPTERDTLYQRVNRAREMVKVVTIPFGVSEKTLSAAAVDKLCEAINAPQLRELVEDPTVVFVILGFSDTQGSAAANLKLSTERAETVADALHEHCKMLSVMQTVGMGSSNFFGEQDKAKNRVAELWAVLP